MQFRSMQPTRPFSKAFPFPYCVLLHLLPVSQTTSLLHLLHLLTVPQTIYLLPQIISTYSTTGSPLEAGPSPKRNAQLAGVCHSNWGALPAFSKEGPGVWNTPWDSPTPSSLHHFSESSPTLQKVNVHRVETPINANWMLSEITIIMTAFDGALKLNTAMNKIHNNPGKRTQLFPFNRKRNWGTVGLSRLPKPC